MLSAGNVPNVIKLKETYVRGAKRDYSHSRCTDDDHSAYLRRIVVPKYTRQKIDDIRREMGLKTISQTIELLVDYFVFDDQREKILIGSVTHKLLRELDSKITR